MSPLAAPALLLGLLVLAAQAAPPGVDAAERTRIAAERQAVEARFEAARRDCEARFLVNDCLDAAREARREALAPLQRQVHLLDDAHRRERAVARLRAIQARESLAAAMPALPGASAPAPGAPAASAAADAEPRPLLRRAVRPAPPASAAEQAVRQRQARHQQRLQAAQAHEAAVQARNARRDAQRRPAEGLPVPATAASAP